MKRFLLSLVAMALVATMVSTADAGRGRYGRPVAAYGWGRPIGPVVVAPRYYAPVYAPVYAARPYYYSPYRYGYGYGVPRTGVYVNRGYYGGGSVIVRTPGFGLNVRY